MSHPILTRTQVNEILDGTRFGWELPLAEPYTDWAWVAIIEDEWTGKPVLDGNARLILRYKLTGQLYAIRFDMPYGEMEWYMDHLRGEPQLIAVVAYDEVIVRTNYREV